MYRDERVSDLENKLRLAIDVGKITKAECERQHKELQAKDELVKEYKKDEDRLEGIVLEDMEKIKSIEARVKEQEGKLAEWETNYQDPKSYLNLLEAKLAEKEKELEIASNARDAWMKKASANLSSPSTLGVEFLELMDENLRMLRAFHQSGSPFFYKHENCGTCDDLIKAEQVVTALLKKVGV